MRCLYPILLLPVPAFAQTDDPHAGLRCETSAECGELRCVEERCIDPEHPPVHEETPLALPGAHVFVGLVALGGPALGGAIGVRWDQNVQPSFLAAVRGGFVDGAHELAIEVSPFTYVYYPSEPGPTFQANVTYGYRIPLPLHFEGVSVSWPLRLGAGFFAGNVGGDVYFQLRGDFVGLSVRYGHVMVDVYLPSFRYAISSAQGITPNLLSWEFGAGVSYVF